MNKKLALLSILPVAVLAAAVPALSNNAAALQLQAEETPAQTIRSFTFNDFSNIESSPYGVGQDDIWCLNPETGNYLGLHGSHILSATNTGITLDDGNGHLQNTLVYANAGQRKYQIALISAVTVYYSGSNLQITLGDNVTTVSNGQRVEADSPKNSISFDNKHGNDITISSIVFEYKC